MRWSWRSFPWTLGVLLAAVAAGGCVYPGGYSKEEWAQLTLEQKHELRVAEQRRRSAEAAARAAASRVAYEAYRVDYEALKDDRLDAPNRVPRTGEVFIVTLLGGTVMVDGVRVRFRPTTAEVWRGESRQLSLRPDPGFHRPPLLISVAVPEDASALLLDADAADPIVLPRQQWQQGHIYTTSDARSKRFTPIDLLVYVRQKEY